MAGPPEPQRYPIPRLFTTGYARAMESDPKPPSAPDTAMVVQFLADRDEPCPRCDYNLRGVQSDVCPECGHTIQLDVVRDVPGVSGLVARMAFVALLLHVFIAGYYLVEYGSASVMSAVSTTHLVIVFASSAAQILMGCVGVVVSIMSKQRGPTIARRVVINWIVAVVLLDAVSTTALVVLDLM